MALNQSQVLSLLHAKRSDFKTFGHKGVVVQQYREAMAGGTEGIIDELSRREAIDLKTIGAEPLEKYPHWTIPFKLKWSSHEESKVWVRERLAGVPTFAVDGSQIYPSKDFSIPIALIQVGWFENRHLDRDYNKGVACDILTPAQLGKSPNREAQERLVNRRRFELETRKLIAYMQKHKGDADPGMVFYDGSLIASFAEQLDRESRTFYVNCVEQLLRTSEQCRVPLVGYIDTTAARDLTVMWRQLFALPEVPGLHDAQLLKDMMQWGDRTPLSRCRRAGILDEYSSWGDKITFCYLKTTNEGAPARLEMPEWMYAEVPTASEPKGSLVERAIDWVRGEVIIGGGYPYAIETADQTAVLKAEDRQVFYRLLQDWAEKENFPLGVSRKMVSKVRRR